MTQISQFNPGTNMSGRFSKTVLGAMLCFLVALAFAHSTSAIGFAGPYDPSNWTLTTNGGDGSVDVSGAPTSIALTGSDSGTDSTIDTDFTTTVLATGTLSFDWSYASSNGSPFFDPFGIILNSTFAQLTVDFGGVNQSGSIEFSVSGGDVFGFRVNTVDDVEGFATATISNFSAPIPEPTASAIFAASFVVVGVALRRPRGVAGLRHQS